MNYAELLATVRELAAQINDLQLLVVQQQRPVVEHLIDTKSRDTKAIEQTLDQLLDVACHDTGLVLFRRLCRYYWTINPENTACYIQGYRKMWDDEQGEEITEKED